MFFNRHKFSFMDIGLRTDIHSHILPGVDDGARDIESSIRILTALHDMGVCRFMLTPHVSGGLYPNTQSGLLARFDSLMLKLPEELASDISIQLASEYMLDEFFEDIETPFTYVDGKSVLVEMSYQSRSANLLDTVFRLIQDGYRPILAHPERYEFYFPQGRKVNAIPELESLVDMGCRLQLNIQSLTGCYGKGSLANLKYLLDHDMYSFLATDIHSSGQVKHYTDFQVSSEQFEKVRQLAANNDQLFATI